MLEFLPAAGSLLSYGSMGTVSKRAIGTIGRHRAVAYSYAALAALLIFGALIMGMAFAFPQGLMMPYLAQIGIGALGSIAEYRALHHGKPSVIIPVGRISGVMVLIASVAFLGEAVSPLQALGSLLIVGAALVIARDEGGRLSMEPWMPFLALSVLCRAYYYTSIKQFVSVLGPYGASLWLEIGIAAAIIAFHALRGKDLSLPRERSLAALPLAAGGLLFCGSVLYSVSVGQIGAGLTSAIYSGTPIVNAVLAYFVLGERMDAAKYLAVGLVVAGLALMVL